MKRSRAEYMAEETREEVIVDYIAEEEDTVAKIGEKEKEEYAGKVGGS